MKTAEALIEEIRRTLKTRTMYFGYSIQISQEELMKVEMVFREEGYSFERSKCPRGHFDIIIKTVLN